MLYPISQNVPMCPICKAKMEKLYRYGRMFFNCNDCNKVLHVIGIGQAEIELICSDNLLEQYEEKSSLSILSQIQEIEKEKNNANT